MVWRSPFYSMAGAGMPILMTVDRYAEAGGAFRMVLPLREVWPTNGPPPAVDFVRLCRCGGHCQTGGKAWAVPK